MQYRFRATSKGSVVLTRSSRRYALSFAFLVFGFFCVMAGFSAILGALRAYGTATLLPFALGLISFSSSLLLLMNRGAPRRMVLDGDGLRMAVKRRKYLILRQDIRGAGARKSVSFGFREGMTRRAILWKAFIALESGSIIPLYEGAARSRAEALSSACSAALARAQAEGARPAPIPDAAEPKPYAIRNEDDGAVVDVPLKVNLPGFFMAAGMLTGTGMIIFGVLPGIADTVILALLAIIWSLIALGTAAAVAFALLGRQRLVIGLRDVEAQRGVLGLSFPPARMDRYEAGATFLDLEDKSLSVISKDLKRELDRKEGDLSAKPDEDPDVEAASEAMRVFLTGRIVRMDVSALSWIDRFRLERDVASLLATAPKAPRDERPGR